jgi:hypothetical protein
MTAFQEAQVSADAQTLILAEYTYLAQELAFCDKTDSDSLNSLTRAIQDFDSAFRVLDVVDDKTLYAAVEKSYPLHKQRADTIRTFAPCSFLLSTFYLVRP